MAASSARCDALRVLKRLCGGRKGSAMGVVVYSISYWTCVSSELHSTQLDPSSFSVVAAAACVSLMRRRATFYRLHTMLVCFEIGERRAASLVQREAVQQRGVGAVDGGGPVVARVRGAVLRVGNQPA